MDGAEAIKKARASPPDALILDIMLPKMSGFEVCRILRKEMTVPILMLTARDDEIDKIVGTGHRRRRLHDQALQHERAAGPGPRHAAAGGYSGTPQRRHHQVGDIEIDVGRHTITRGGKVLSLTPKEFDLLAFLARNKGLVFSRDQLLEKVWGYDYAGDTRTVDVHVRWLREKIEANPDAAPAPDHGEGRGLQAGGISCRAASIGRSPSP